MLRIRGICRFFFGMAYAGRRSFDSTLSRGSFPFIFTRDNHQRTMIEERKQEDAAVAMPRADVFSGTHAINSSIMGAGARFHVFDHVEYPEEGGIYVWYKGMPYPKKGFPFPEATFQNDITKRIFMSILRPLAMKEMLLPGLAFLLLPWKRKIKVANNSMREFNRIASWTLSACFLVPERYSHPAQTINKMLTEFIKNLGIDEENNIGRVIATMIEYDDAYRYRIQDLGSEIRWREMKTNPRKEIKRLLKIYMEREKVPNIFAVKGTLLFASTILWHPKILRAFKKAILTLSWTEQNRLGLDNADRYHILMRGDYNFTGRTFEERKEIYQDMHRVSFCCHYKVEHTANGKDYFCLKCQKDCETGYIFPPEIEIAPQ